MKKMMMMNKKKVNKRSWKSEAEKVQWIPLLTQYESEIKRGRERRKEKHKGNEDG